MRVERKGGLGVWQQISASPDFPVFPSAFPAVLSQLFYYLLKFLRIETERFAFIGKREGNSSFPGERAIDFQQGEGSRRTEVGGRRSGVRSPRSEVRGRKPEDGR